MPSASAPTHRLRAVVGALAAAILTIALTSLVSLGSIYMVLALIVPLGIIVLCIFGADKVGFALLCVGYALAALSKGKYAAPAGPSLTLSDVALLFGFILMAPRVVRGRNKVSAAYAGGMLLVVVVGFMASALNPPATSSIKTLLGMIWCMVMIPIALAALRPNDRRIEILAWSFIGGHTVSVLYSLATHPLAKRALGLTAQPNEYAESGLIVICLALYLLGRTTRRWPIFLVSALALVSIYTSGSRGALISLAVLAVVIPIVERTTLASTLFAAMVALGAVFIPIASESAGKNSALSRLLGNGTASASDNIRNQGLSNGWQQFLQRPFSGHGLSSATLGLIHSNLLEIAVGLGVFGFAGFVLVVIAMSRPLFGDSIHRRLGYTVVAFVVFSATAPALTDRSMWVAMSLGFVYFRGFKEEQFTDDPDPAGATSATAKQHELVVHADHLPQFG